MRLTEDERVAALQQTLLRALREGAWFATSHQEGGSRIVWTGRHYLREDHGEFPDRITYTDDAAFLQALRRFFDWAVRRQRWPDNPTEHEVWRYILEQLHRDPDRPQARAAHTAVVNATQRCNE